MSFLLAEILNFQGSTHRIGVGSLSILYKFSTFLILTFFSFSLFLYTSQKTAIYGYVQFLQNTINVIINI